MMVNTKNRSTPVVEKKAVKEEKGCGCGCENCTCGEDCKCGCHKVGRTLLLCGTILVSAALVAGAIFMRPVGPKHARLSSPQMKSIIKMNNQAIHDYIVKNPKVIVESVEQYFKAEEAKQRAAAPAVRPPFDLNKLEPVDAALVQQIVNDKTNYSLGNKDGKFVIIEFFDHQCGWCKRTNKAMEEAVASEAGKNIRWIPIDTPIFGEASETIARYVLAAGEQGKYAEMHKAVGNDTTELSGARARMNAAVKEYVAKNKLDPNVPADMAKVTAYTSEMTAKEYGAALETIGKSVGLNAKKLTTAANSAKIKGKLKSNEEFRNKLQIRGVPMLIVDGRKKGGALFGEDLDTVVKLSADKK